MVGKTSFSALRHRMREPSTTSDDGLTPTSTRHTYDPISNHVPFIASPLDPKTTDWLKNKNKASNLTLKRRPTIAQQEASRVAGGLFRKQHEASPLELFFDLFFVANLAIYGFDASQASGAAIGNYIGFFSLMWSYWFHVSIHDVRFYVDSILNRFFKLCQFAIFTSFAGLGQIYRVLEGGGMTRAFHGMALVFMLSRLILMVQYGVLLWFVRDLKKTLLPMSLTMLIYLCSAMAFLGTFVSGVDHELDATEGAQHVWTWYIFIAVEALLVITVSSIWRILSFKHTHLVERAGLLTLIVMGEGIIGLIKSISLILKGTEINIWQASGRVISGVFLIYLMFVLYFSPIAHDRFGTIRQQIWVLLHLPVHIAILLTEEGSSEFLLWTTIYSARERLLASLPSLSKPSEGYATITDLVSSINSTMKNTSADYTYYKLEDKFDWASYAYKIQNLTSKYTYGSDDFNKQASTYLSTIANGTTNYFFENFQFKGPKEVYKLKDTNQKTAVYYGGIQVIFTMFYVASGGMLLVLAVMYWIGKTRKTWDEWLAILVRFLVGTALICVTIVGYTEFNDPSGYMFRASGWLVSVTVLCWLAVIIFENKISNIWYKRYSRKLSKGEIDPELEARRKSRYNGIFGPQASNDSTVDVDTHHAEKSFSEKPRGIHFQDQPSRSRSDSQVGEHDNLVSADNGDDDNAPTLSGRRDSEQVRRTSSPKPLYPYQLPPTSTVTSSYGQLNSDTEYRGNESMDVSRPQYHNHSSFEQEPMMSPSSWTDRNLDRPQEGYHRPEEMREH